MNTHLTDDDFAAVVAGLEASSKAAEHLSSCVSCRQEVAELQRLVADRLRGMEAEAPDWQSQRQEVMARLADRSTHRRAPAHRWLRPLLAVAAAVVVAVGLVLLMPHGTATSPPPEDLDVEQILAEVDAVLADDSLPGFEPIDLGFEDPEIYVENGTS